MRPNLTAKLGLRYESFNELHDGHNVKDSIGGTPEISLVESAK